jgi:hypothetical protein
MWTKREKREMCGEKYDRVTEKNLVLLAFRWDGGEKEKLINALVFPNGKEL